MKVFVYNSQKKLPIKKLQVRKIAQKVVVFEGHPYYDEVAIHFVDREKICALHEQFFQDPSPTDCISFPMSGDEPFEYRMLGEVFVCPEVGIEYVDKHGGNYYNEITLYVVHGLLHLLGYDDIERKDRTLMRGAERRHMAHLHELGIVLS